MEVIDGSELNFEEDFHQVTNRDVIVQPNVEGQVLEPWHKLKVVFDLLDAAPIYTKTSPSVGKWKPYWAWRRESEIFQGSSYMTYKMSNLRNLEEKKT